MSVSPVSEFKLDERLQQDCILIEEQDEFIVLLMNNALVPWIVLVPKTTETEFYQLEPSLQQTCLEKVNRYSRFLKDELQVDKINVATIGNIVSQMHIHIVGRRTTDPAWPGVVWGMKEKRAYTENEHAKMSKKIQRLDSI
ncbi:MAG: HIT family protein [Gammaproteobacteria bacterium]|nr:HIT family protein [Gammaproteobacteria bacterium]